MSPQNPQNPVQAQPPSIKPKSTMSEAKTKLDELKGLGKNLASTALKEKSEAEKRAKLNQEYEKARKAIMDLPEGNTPSTIAAAIMHMYSVAAKLGLYLDAKVSRDITGGISKDILKKIVGYVTEHPKMQKAATPEELASGVDCKIDATTGVLTTEFTLQNQKLDADQQKIYETLLHGFLQNEGYAIEVNPNGDIRVIDPLTSAPIDQKKLEDIMGLKNGNFAEFCDDLAENRPGINLSP
jgi:DNA-binding ferritin-like protein (Dps family)